MADLRDVRDRTWGLFLAPSLPQRMTFAAAVLDGRAPGPASMFSAFDEAQVARAMDIAADFMRIGSEGAAPDALHAVLDAYRGATQYRES